MLRTGIATNESVAETLKEHGTPLSYGATPEKWVEALTTISGTDETIKPREIENKIGFQSTNETVLTSFNSEETENVSFNVTLNFMKDGKIVSLKEMPVLGGVEGMLDTDGIGYVFNGFTEALVDAELSYKYKNKKYTDSKSYNGDIEDVITIA